MQERDPETRLRDVLYGFNDHHQRFRVRIVDDHFDRGELMQLLGEQIGSEPIRSRHAQGKDARLDTRELAELLVTIVDLQDAVDRQASEVERLEDKLAVCRERLRSGGEDA